MKRFVLLSALLLATPAFAADTPADPTVREYVANTATTDWFFDGGWTFDNGVLTHYPGAAGKAQPIGQPALEPGKVYRLHYAFSGRTKGTVSVGIGNQKATYAPGNQVFTVRYVAASASDVFTITTSADFDGSVSNVSMVQLGADQSATASWNTVEGWSVANGELTHTAGNAGSLEAALSLQAGHTYELSFNVGATDNAPLAGNGTVTLAGQNIGWFLQQGGWNFLFDFKAGADNTLAFVPTEASETAAGFNGVIRHLNIREITTDAPPAPPAPTGQQQ